MESAPLIGQWIKSIANKINELITYKVEEQKEINDNNNVSSAPLYNYYVTSTPKKNYVYSTERKASNSNSLIGQKRRRDLSEDDIYVNSKVKGGDLISACRKHVNANIMSAHIKTLTSQLIKNNIKRSKSEYRTQKKLYVYSDSKSQEKKKKINETFQLIFDERKKKLNEFFSSKIDKE